MIDVTLLHEDAVMPRRATDRAAGFDLHAAQDLTLPPGEWRMVDTGVAVEFPPGWHGQVCPRSGLAYKLGIDKLAGTIDEDFRGGIGVVLINHAPGAFNISIGDRIAQLVPVYSGQHELRFKESLSGTDRDNRGWGSTGK